MEPVQKPRHSVRGCFLTIQAVADDKLKEAPEQLLDPLFELADIPLRDIALGGALFKAPAPHHAVQELRAADLPSAPIDHLHGLRRQAQYSIITHGFLPLRLGLKIPPMREAYTRQLR